MTHSASIPSTREWTESMFKGWKERCSAIQGVSLEEARLDQGVLAQVVRDSLTIQINDEELTVVIYTLVSKFNEYGLLSNQ